MPKPTITPAQRRRLRWIKAHTRPPQHCRVCGCTNSHGCIEGCWWVEPDLCSMCVAEDDEGEDA